MKNRTHEPTKANKTDAGNGSYGICRVIDASRSPSPDPGRSAQKMNSCRMTSDFITERIEVIASSAHERESGNETAERILSYLRSHKEGNETEMRQALVLLRSMESPFFRWAGDYLLGELELTEQT